VWRARGAGRTSYTVPDPEADRVEVVLPALPTDRAALLEPRYGAIGVARVGDLWVAGRLVASLRRGRARRALRSRRLRAGRYELKGAVRRSGRWRLSVRFDGAAGWADAALASRTLRFAPRRHPAHGRA
jgi:hypothetical protein